MRSALTQLLHQAQAKRQDAGGTTKRVGPRTKLPEAAAQGQSVRRGGNPVWPLILVLLALGAAAFLFVISSGDESDEPAPGARPAAAPPEPQAPQAVARVEPVAAETPDREEDEPVVADVPAPAEAPARPEVEPAAPTPPAAEAPARPEAEPAAPALGNSDPPQAVASLPPAATEPAPATPVEPPAAAKPATEPPAEAVRPAPEPAPRPAPLPALMAGPLILKPAQPAELTAALDRLAQGETGALTALATFAEAGWPEAEAALGLALATGEGVAKDTARGLKLLQQAARQGDAEAQYRLGEAHLKGSFAAAEPVTALAWFILAATRGHREAEAQRFQVMTLLGANERHRAFNLARNLGPEAVAGWSLDPANGTAVWLPSWFRTGAYTLQVEVPAADGRAHGIGSISLDTDLSGSSDRTFKGRFFRGYYFGERVREEEVHYLPTDDFLFRLPASGADVMAGIGLWLRVDYGVDIATAPCYVAINRKPDLLLATPDGFPALDDDRVKAAMHEAWRLYQEACPENYHADLYVLPAAFERRLEGRRLEYAPRIASATFYGKRGESLSVGQFENQALRAHEAAEREAEKRREREARAEQRRQAETAAQTRGNPDVRGLRLGMTLKEVRALFGDEVAEWEPRWQPDTVSAPYAQAHQKLRLSDGASILASFTSPLNGSVLFAFVYEQNFRDGIDRERLAADLKAKYGEPDQTTGNGAYWTYALMSREADKSSAFMKVTLRSLGRDASKASFLRLAVNDAAFGREDERAAYQARIKAQRDAAEARKSDKPKF